jgi:hypothetical protein
LTDELPYDITVEIEQYELEGEMQRIAARIFVDKIFPYYVLFRYKFAVVVKEVFSCMLHTICIFEIINIMK